jgi:hypothetical protein
MNDIEEPSYVTKEDIENVNAIIVAFSGGCAPDEQEPIVRKLNH